MNMKKKELIDTDLEIKKEVGENIKRIRRSLRTFSSAEKVSKNLGISRVAYTQIENGKNHVNAVTLWKLATLFGCEVKEFFPSTPEGFELSPKDLEAIKKVDEKAVDWAERLFKKVTK